ncbi:MAG: aminoacyl-tRNA hydrolase [Solobacterium sp.]|nr:aminoacyl-tRNA hydrolase [Solobacterium sp.]
MKLIVGLGNPGKEYEKTRHNSGFQVMDLLAEKCHCTITREKWSALIAPVQVQGVSVLLMKPLTYMNDSGRAVAQAVNFYHIVPEDILVIHDDIDLPVGNLRIRQKGSDGGQKGMRSIIQALGTQNITRIRIGVGHSEPGNHKVVPDWVLSPVEKDLREEHQSILQKAADASYAWINTPLELVMSTYNTKKKPPKKEAPIVQEETE